MWDFRSDCSTGLRCCFPRQVLEYLSMAHLEQEFVMHEGSDIGKPSVTDALYYGDGGAQRPDKE
jgi:hypothetical protein